MQDICIADSSIKPKSRHSMSTLSKSKAAIVDFIIVCIKTVWLILNSEKMNFNLVLTSHQI